MFAGAGRRARGWHDVHAHENGTGGGRTPTEVPATGAGKAVEETVTGTVDDVTKLLTGDVPTLVDEVPVVGPVVGDTLGGVVGGAGDTLDQTTDSLLD